MIIVKISGGIGNQLFQYAFGRSLSEKYNTELKFDIKTNNNSSGFTNRCLCFDKFNINLNSATEREIRKYKYFDDGYLARIERKMTERFPFLNKKYIIQSSYDYYSNINKIRNTAYYDGYWQSEKYFKSIENIIKRELKLEIPLDNDNYVLLSNIINSESVSIHVRRGDYISIKANRNIFPVCSVDYYKQGIDFFTKKFKDPVFYFFSDDIEWAKNNFKGEKFRFVNPNSNEPEVDLFLMSKCYHNIIANSTFSWWGAWLNSNSNKIVMAPKNWYGGSLNLATEDLIPKGWMKI